MQKQKTKLLEIKNLKMNYPLQSDFGGWITKKEYIKALNGVNLDIYKGEILGLVGESGCGKSTLGKAVLRLINAEGMIFYENENIPDFNTTELKSFR